MIQITTLSRAGRRANSALPNGRGLVLFSRISIFSTVLEAHFFAGMLTNCLGHQIGKYGSVRQREDQPGGIPI